MILNRANQGAFPYRHTTDGGLLAGSTPPLGEPSFGWGLRSSEEVANHPTRRALFTEKEALPLRRESHFSARSPKGLGERTRR